MPTFSIVTVVLNDLSGLRKTAASLAHQSFTDFEWIVVDGASTDQQKPDPGALTPEPIVFISEPDQGIYDAMNKGWKLASGEWILFLNAGDALCQDRTLEDVAEQLKGSQALWAFGMVRNVDQQGRVIGIQNASPFNRMGQALGNTTVPHQATLMRRSLIHQLEGFRLDFDTAADQELIYRAAKIAEPRELVWPIANFEIDGRGMQVPASRVVQLMRRARKQNNDRYLGSSVADFLVSSAVMGVKAARPAASRLAH